MKSAQSHDELVEKARQERQEAKAAFDKSKNSKSGLHSESATERYSKAIRRHEDLVREGLDSKSLTV